MGESSGKNRSVLIGLALVTVTVAAFYQVYTFEFVNFDDPLYVYENPNIQAGVTLKSIKWAFTSGHAGNWHPLTWLSHMLDWQLFGPDPAGHHLTNLVLHIANTLLLFTVLKQMTRAPWRSAFVAALFAIHPLHIESVAWVTERKDVLSAFFWMLTMLTYVRYAEHPCVKRYLLILLSFALGLMTKPMLVTLPFVLLLLDYWPLGRIPYKQEISKTSRFGWRMFYHLILEKLPFFGLSAASSIVTFIAQRSGGSVRTWQFLPLDIRIFNALVSYVSYIAKAFYPSRLAVLYPHPGTKLPVWQALLSFLALAGVTIVIIYTARRRRYLAVGWLWYLGTLVPVIGLVQVGLQAMADRYTYLPSIGIFIMVAWGAAELFTSLHLRKIVPAVSAGIILAALLVCTRMQVRYWRDSIFLCGHALEVTEDNHVMHNNYGNALRDKGRFDEAITHFKRSIEINPRYVKAYINLGMVYFREEKIMQAAACWNEALELEPDNIGVLNNLAWLRATAANPEFRNPDQAVELALRACEQAQYNQPDIMDTLAAAYAAAGRFSQAIETAEKALELCQSPEQEALKEEIKNRLVLYKAGKPYIEGN
jgi:tetratricopeptide (TPR) repeat protein